MKKSWEHFAHVEIDLNMSNTLHNRILMEHEDYPLFIELEYDNLPIFYGIIVFVGHSIDKYWKSKGIMLKSL